MINFNEPLIRKFLQSSQEIFLFSDFDGTLVDFAKTPDEVIVSEDLLSDVSTLCSNTEFILVTGRSIASVRRNLHIPTLRVSGCHGVEHSDGTVEKNAVAFRSRLLTVQYALENALSEYTGVWIEKKPYSFAIHYREAPDCAGEISRVVDASLRGYEGILFVCEGTLVIEICISGCDKGGAIDYWLTKHDTSTVVPFYVGDDVTDEYGFRAVNKRGGVSIRIGRSDDSCADYYFDDIQHYLSFIKNLLHQD
ncbi:trehalose-phosphatase [Gammaproteobacteria bacterium 45_16_T64]|nr:trehalose-phosphatase [Gammaproteobacteria bacterium 45_16_T64]